LWALGIMIYEMLVGYSPFVPLKAFSQENEKLIKENILKGEFSFPYDFNEIPISMEAKNLLRRMLCPQVKRRLRLENVMDHEFFKIKIPLQISIE